MRAGCNDAQLPVSWWSWLGSCLVEWRWPQIWCSVHFWCIVCWCALVCSIVHSSLLAHSLHSALVVQRWPQTLRMTSAHVQSLLLNCSLVHSLLLKFTEQIRWKGIMQWCTGALMHWWCIVWHCSGALWICDSIEVQFYTLWKSSEIWEIFITFGDFDPQLWWPISFFKDFDHCWRLLPAVVWLISEFAAARSIFRSAAPHNLLWQVSKYKVNTLTSFLIQGKYFANQRYFEAQTRATGLTCY